MAIRLYFTQEGNLEINSLEQNNFSIEEEGTVLVLPFRTIEKDRHHIIINPGEKLNETIEYILSELKNKNYIVELDSYLKKYWDNYILEKNKIRDIRREKTRLSVDNKAIRPIFKYTRQPFSHQLRGIRHALNLENAANFSVPGSGKTQVALGIFMYLKTKKVVEKCFVIGPASCFEPWENEARECLQRPITVLRWSGSVTKRRRIGSLARNSDLILITYQTACNDFLLLEQILRRYKTLLVLDESHHVKNPNGSRAKAILRLSPFSTKRLILTGTPAPHSLFDVWTQFSFLWPSQQLIKDFYSFKRELESHKNPAVKLKRDLNPYFIRTTKKELGLPEIKWDIDFINKKDIPSEQRKIIDLLELKTLTEARKFGLSDVDMDVLYKWRIARIIRLLQAASNPALLLKRIDCCNIEKSLDVDMSDLVNYANVFLSLKKLPIKIDIVIKKTKALVESGKKVIVWSWFVENLCLLEKLLNKYNPLMIYGEIKPYEEKEDSALEESRERNIRDFKKKKDRPILLANPAACAESISLHKQCQDAIYLDRNFNCGQFLQSMDRIHRVGMPRDTTALYHIPIIDCAIERSIDKRLKKRQQDLYTVLNDPMPVLGVDDDAWLADSTGELNDAFDDVIKEIKNEKRKHSI